ncbi:hypothetical protein EV693_10524 [Nicoletella semolina]|uniref:Uncharacterized protein n=1 Tax=Nicoletella semolina TaxID=271160 RepID=A0A4R2N976_9PAST|nr:hypothetical protein [Nicoletella semolina]MDH2925486.1 hypothetical protein [Nicoletella semolina]TCP17561.1 hypothetical protein EV693_10524 [Nicoletella semolina]
MKKFTISLFALISANVMAVSSIERPQENIPPKLRFGVFEVKEKGSRLLESNQFSVSNKEHKLCWAAFDMPFDVSNTVIEVFYSPKKAKFIDTIQQVSTSEDGKTHTVTSKLPSQQGKFIERCWTFDKNDPLGKYSVDIQVNDIIFPTQYFEVTK